MTNPLNPTPRRTRRYYSEEFKSQIIQECGDDRASIAGVAMRHSCAVALLQSGTDVTVIRDYLGHASIATTGRYLTTNLKMKRDAMQTFWKHAGIEPSRTKSWKPKPDLLAFLQAL